MTTFTVTRISSTEFRVETDRALSDNTFASAVMEVRDGALRPVSGLDFGYRFRVVLGPIASAKVEALAIGETIVLR